MRCGFTNLSTRKKEEKMQNWLTAGPLYENLKINQNWLIGFNLKSFLFTYWKSSMKRKIAKYFPNNLIEEWKRFAQWLNAQIPKRNKLAYNMLSNSPYRHSFCVLRWCRCKQWEKGFPFEAKYEIYMFCQAFCWPTIRKFNVKYTPDMKRIKVNNIAYICMVNNCFKSISHSVCITQRPGKIWESTKKAANWFQFSLLSFSNWSTLAPIDSLLFAYWLHSWQRRCKYKSIHGIWDKCTMNKRKKKTQQTFTWYRMKRIKVC